MRNHPSFWWAKGTKTLKYKCMMFSQRLKKQLGARWHKYLNTLGICQLSTVPGHLEWCHSFQWRHSYYIGEKGNLTIWMPRTYVSILKYEPQVPWTYICVLMKPFLSFTWLFASFYRGRLKGLPTKKILHPFECQGLVYCLMDGQRVLLAIAMLYFVVLTKFIWTGRMGTSSPGLPLVDRWSIPQGLLAAMPSWLLSSGPCENVATKVLNHNMVLYKRTFNWEKLGSVWSSQLCCTEGKMWLLSALTAKDHSTVGRLVLPVRH